MRVPTLPTRDPTLTARQRLLIAAYRARDMTVRDILVTHEATRSELDTALSRGREPFRRPASARPGRNLLRRAPVDPSAAERGEVSLERRLARLLSERIAELEDRSFPGRSADPEMTARALALSVSTLASLRRTVARRNEHDIDGTLHERPARSLTTLRDELYGHLLRIRDEEQSRQGTE